MKDGQPTDCVECAREERKKKDKETHYVNEHWDAKFKETQNRTNGTNVWGGNHWETIPNPTVTPAERKIYEGKHPDEDINNAAKNAKVGKVYSKVTGADKNAEKVTESEHDRLKHEKERAEDIAKAEAEHGKGPHKAPMTAEEKKAHEAENAAAVKEEKEQAKKEAEATVEKNPVPKEEKKLVQKNNLNEKQVESI